MKVNRFKQLKKKLSEEKDLSKIWLFYMDHFADHEEFTNQGKRAKNSYIDLVLETTCEHLFGKRAKIKGFLLVHIAEQQFFHGGFDVDGRIGGVIYFEDINIGMCAISAESPPTEVMKYSRFSDGRKYASPTQHELN
jgi:hypothetical protein